jgi:hypothetical protein
MVERERGGDRGERERGERERERERERDILADISLIFLIFTPSHDKNKNYSPMRHLSDLIRD